MSNKNGKTHAECLAAELDSIFTTHQENLKRERSWADTFVQRVTKQQSEAALKDSTVVNDGHSTTTFKKL